MTKWKIFVAQNLPIDTKSPENERKFWMLCESATGYILQMTVYRDRPLNYIYKPYIYKMRISAHNFNIETGRFYNLDLMKECVVCVT